jgi:copper transport protein
VGCLTALAVLLPLSPASAHATLVSTDPPDGAVLQASPEVITFTFDETVSLTPSSIQVFDARGNAVPAKVEGRDKIVSASVPARLPEGTYVVAWRVVSADSHPIAGSISFSVGTPSATVQPPKTQVGDDGSLTQALSVTAALNYLSLFLAGGLVLFVLWVLEGTKLRPAVADRLAMGRWVGACIAVFTAVQAVLLQGAADLGAGLHAVGDLSSLDLSLVGDEVVVLALQVAGLAAALLLVRRHRWLATAGALVAVASPAWVGHSRSSGPEALVLPADVVHLLAGAIWLGGLVGLGITLGSLRGRERDAAMVLSRFSAIGATVLAALTVTGAIASWRILGSWSALFHTGYGQVLLVKIGVVAVAALAAGYNRWRLLPQVIAGVGHQARSTAALRVRTAVWCEAGLLVVVLGLTGFLSDLSPNQQPATRAPVASRVTAAVVGEMRVLATVSPGSIGRNTLTVQVQDQAGEPVEGYSAPTVSVTSGQVDLGAVSMRPIASGTYAAEVIFPHTGTWTVRVGLRLSRFDNPVSEVAVRVR